MTEYPEWQAALDAAGRLLNIHEPIWRGVPWAVKFSFPADYSADAFVMSIADAPDGASELYDVTLGSPTYANGKTTILASLNGTQTGGLPADGAGNDTDGDEVVTLFYSLRRTPDGEGQYTERAGTVKVLGRPDVD